MRTVTLIFCLGFSQIQSYNGKCRFFTGVNTFRVTQSNKPVIDEINKLSKSRKANFISTFHCSTLYTKLPLDKLLMELNNFINFCFDRGENKCVTARSYSARQVKDIKGN